MSALSGLAFCLCAECVGKQLGVKPSIQKSHDANRDRNEKADDVPMFLDCGIRQDRVVPTSLFHQRPFDRSRELFLLTRCEAALITNSLMLQVVRLTETAPT